MKKLKLFFVAILLMVASLALSGQSYVQQAQQQKKFVPHPTTVATTNITLDQVQNGWALHGQSCAGCPSYWYQVLVTQVPIQAEDGLYYYYYYFYFFSNSHYTNGVQASTYLSQVRFYCNGALAITAPYILLPVGQQVWATWIRFGADNATAQFKVTNASVQ